MTTIENIKVYGSNGGLVLAILFIIVALGLNIRAASWISFANKYGTRERLECGNEYLEIITPNYQIYELIKGDPGDIYHGKEASKIMTNAFILVQVSWIVLITGLFILVTADLYDIILLDKRVNTFEKIKHPAVILLVVSVAGYISYLSTYSVYINKLVDGMKNADLAASGVPKVSNMSQLYALYLPTLAVIIPILYIIVYQSLPFNSSYYIYAILYVIIISIAIQFNSTSLNLISTVNTSYAPTIEDLQNKVKSILGTNPTQVPNRAADRTAQDQLKIDLIQNIKSVETTDGDNFILNDYKEQLWKYLLHQNGNELQNLLTNYPNDPKIGAITTAVNKIRIDMRNLRTDTSLQKAASAFTTSTLQFAIIIFFVIFYAIFHFIYKHLARPIHASVGTASIVLLLVIIGPLYGWLQAVINKTR